eukprot:scaffold109740_cov31-Tisochrysis_lutea.AAC.1
MVHSHWCFGAIIEEKLSPPPASNHPHPSTQSTYPRIILAALRSSAVGVADMKTGCARRLRRRLALLGPRALVLVSGWTAA